MSWYARVGEYEEECWYEGISWYEGVGLISCLRIGGGGGGW